MLFSSSVGPAGNGEMSRDQMDEAFKRIGQLYPKVKVTPKKPAPRKHLVKKGDTLYGLSKRYGTTVGKIQKANGISGSMIRIGQRLKIPR